MTDVWDKIEAQIAELVLVEQRDFQTAIGVVCAANPLVSSDFLLLSAISFVTHLESFSEFSKKEDLVQSRRRYQVIAALAADVALLSTTKRNCEDLREFWTSSASTVFKIAPRPDPPT